VWSCVPVPGPLSSAAAQTGMAVWHLWTCLACPSRLEGVSVPVAESDERSENDLSPQSQRRAMRAQLNGERLMGVPRIDFARR